MRGLGPVYHVQRMGTDAAGKFFDFIIELVHGADLYTGWESAQNRNILQTINDCLFENS